MPEPKANGRATVVRPRDGVALGVTILILVLTSSSGAVAKVTHSPTGHFLGVLPSTLHTKTLQAGAANGTPPLIYHGGPVQHSSRAYVIFWVPSGYYYPANVKSEVVRYFNDVNADNFKTSNVYAAATQYCSGPQVGATSCISASDSFASYNVSYGGSITVTKAFPSSGCPNYTLANGSSSKVCLVDTQLRSEIDSVVAADHWTTGLSSEVFLLTPPLVGDCFDSSGGSCYDPEFSSGYCAYHSNVTSPQTLYAIQPWADITGCHYDSSTLPDNAYPNDDGADPLVNVISKEQSATITDPLGTAWYDSSGFENGDECAWQSLATQFNGIGDYSQTINGDPYLMQMEWSNRANDCVETNTFPQPTGTFTATAGSTAHSENFTASVHDSDDSSFRYSWAFGDGSSGSSVAKPSHTYAAAGNKKVTLTVFDAHGDQLHVSKTITVS